MTDSTADVSVAGQTDLGSVKQKSLRGWVVQVLAIVLSIYVLIEVNFSLLAPLKELAIFAGLGLMLCFLTFPLHRRWADRTMVAASDWVLAGLAAICCGYLVLIGAELGQRAGIYKPQDLAIGAIGLLLVFEATRRSIGLALPLLALIFVLYAHKSIAQELPDWLFPHRGQDFDDLIGQTYLRTEGVFGTALGVMFRYVFLFVLFGAFLEASGATGYIISLATRLFGKKAGGPAKVAVLASGLMGSLSGSAVANAATTGTFTIPLMRSVGFRPHIAAAIEAAASSGGALMPPVMGAGAYMMLEIINRNPPVTYLEICKAALIPAILFYLSIFLLVHFYAKRIDATETVGDVAEGVAGSSDQTSRRASDRSDGDKRDVSPGDVVAAARAHGAMETSPVPADRSRDFVSAGNGTGENEAKFFSFEGLTFFGALGGLMVFLISGFTPFRSVTFSLAFVVAMILINPRTVATVSARLTAWGVWAALTGLAYQFAPVSETWADAMIWGLAGLLLVGLAAKSWRSMIIAGIQTSASGGIPLIVAAACVGIIIGLVSRTGVGTGVPQAIIPLAGNSLFLALLAIMGCSIVLGMGLPSAVSYLLLATVIGPVFADPSLGVPIVAAHLFIFYFGMMAMVTPPVALAAYATASIAGSGVMETGLAAFRFSLVGFTLPFMFVYRPELCLMAADGGPPEVLSVLLSVTAACIGVVSLSAAMAGYLLSPLGWMSRCVLLVAAACSLYPDQASIGASRISVVDLVGATLLMVVAVTSLLAGKAQAARG
jgi:TRAP transporter 4TM/12TM fusion protein